MSQTAVIHARIDPATKAATERVLDALGLTPTEAIRLLYRQIAMRGEFPVELRIAQSWRLPPLMAKADQAARRSRPSTTTDDLYASWE